MTDMTETAAKLEDLRDQMLMLVEEATQLLRHTDVPELTYERARQYWIGHIKSALGDDNYPTYSPTMQSTIDELMAEPEADDD